MEAPNFDTDLQFLKQKIDKGADYIVTQMFFDNAKFFDETERVTNLGYQFTINAEQTADKTAIQNVRAMAKIIDNYMKQPKYRCLRRIGALVIVPTQGDDNVLQGHLRYNCHLFKDTNTIYRRY